MTGPSKKQEDGEKNVFRKVLPGAKFHLYMFSGVQIPKKKAMRSNSPEMLAHLWTERKSPGDMPNSLSELLTLKLSAEE